jgi:hypothetical protein
MRARAIPILLTIVWALIWAAPAFAADPALAQDTGDEEVVGEEEEAEGQEEGAGGDPAEETGAEEGQTEPAAEETGPPWTYQMARIGIVLLVFMALGVGLAYYRFVVRRQRGLV